RFSLVNEQGHTMRRGVNGGPTFESRAQFGDIVTMYVQPELLGNEDFTQARLATGYLKLTLWNVELLVGRDSLAWGPGYHNSLPRSSIRASETFEATRRSGPTTSSVSTPSCACGISTATSCRCVTSGSTRSTTGTIPAALAVRAAASATSSRPTSIRTTRRRASWSACTTWGYSDRTGWRPGPSTRGARSSRSTTISSRTATGPGATSYPTSSAPKAATISGGSRPA